jgi:hypothetical protein
MYFCHGMLSKKIILWLNQKEKEKMVYDVVAF